MIKCPYCGKEFDEKAQPKEKWYFTTYWVVIAILCVVPFALPLVWFNPRYKPVTKWIVTVVVFIATVWICYELYYAWQLFKQWYYQIQQMLGGTF